MQLTDESFEALLDQWDRLIVREVKRYAATPREVGEIRHDVRVQAALYRHAYDPRLGAFSTWLMGIVRAALENRDPDRKRSNRRKQRARKDGKPSQPRYVPLHLIDSLDVTMPGCLYTTYADQLPDPGATPEEIAVAQAERERVVAVVNQLSERDRDSLLAAARGELLRETAARYGVSRERERQVRQRAAERARLLLAASGD